MAFKDGGSVKKLQPPAPSPTRPALGPQPNVNPIGSKGDYHPKAGAEQPSAPMPGPGGDNKITLIPANFENVQEQEG